MTRNNKEAWVVKEKDVNKVITVMCDCMIFPLGNRYDYMDWMNKKVNGTTDEVNDSDDASIEDDSTLTLHGSSQEILRKIL